MEVAVVTGVRAARSELWGESEHFELAVLVVT